MPEETLGTSVETEEVADLPEETGAEEPEVADPESETVEEPTEHQRTAADASFAEMRRQMQEAQQAAEDARAELAELQAQNEARQSAYSRLTGKDEDADIAALAEVTGMSEDEIRAEMEAAQESAQKDIRIQQLEEQINAEKAERLMQADLERLRKIDPSLKSLDDLGPEYWDMMQYPKMTPERAYWAIQAERRANHRTPPKPPGTVVTGSAEKDTFTEAEIDAMSPEQLRKNSKKILASWGGWD